MGTLLFIMLFVICLQDGFHYSDLTFIGLAGLMLWLEIKDMDSDKLDHYMGY